MIPKEDAKKELLTRKMIKRELLQSHYLGAAAVIPIMAFLVVGTVYIFKRRLQSLFPKNAATIGGIADFLYAAAAIAAIIGIVYTVRYIWLIKKERFLICKDKLVQTVDRIDNAAYLKPSFELHFQNGYKYEHRRSIEAPAQMYSEQISQNRIYPRDFFETAAVGDVFILVVLGKEVVFAFNTKFFELEEDTENS